MFPEVAERAVTIHNMVSAHYFREESSPERIPQIIHNRLDRESELAVPKFLSLRESAIFYRRVLAPDRSGTCWWSQRSNPARITHACLPPGTLFGPRLIPT